MELPPRIERLAPPRVEPARPIGSSGGGSASMKHAMSVSITSGCDDAVNVTLHTQCSPGPSTPRRGLIVTSPDASNGWFASHSNVTLSSSLGAAKPPPLPSTCVPASPATLPSAALPVPQRLRTSTI